MVVGETKYQYTSSEFFSNQTKNRSNRIFIFSQFFFHQKIIRPGTSTEREPVHSRWNKIQNYKRKHNRWMEKNYKNVEKIKMGSKTKKL